MGSRLRLGLDSALLTCQTSGTHRPPRSLGALFCGEGTQRDLVGRAQDGSVSVLPGDVDVDSKRGDALRKKKKKQA